MRKRWPALLILLAMGCGSGNPLVGIWASKEPNFPAFGLKGSKLKFDEKNVMMSNGKSYSYHVDGNRLHIDFPDAAEEADAQFTKSGDSMTMIYEGKEHEYKQVQE